MGCNAQPDIVASFPKDSCEDVSLQVEPVARVKPSDHLETVQKLACFYGYSSIHDEKSEFDELIDATHNIRRFGY